MKYQKELEIVGLGVIISGYLLMLLTFFTAYFNNYIITISINNLNEANIEAILLSAGIIPVSLFIISYLKDLKKYCEELKLKKQTLSC